MDIQMFFKLIFGWLFLITISCTQNPEEKVKASIVLDYSYDESGKIQKISEIDTLKNEVHVREYFSSGGIEKKYSYIKNGGNYIFIDSTFHFYPDGNLFVLLIHKTKNIDFDVNITFSRNGGVERIDTIRGEYISTQMFDENRIVTKESIIKNDTLLYLSLLKKDSLRGEYHDIQIFPDIKINGDTFLVNSTLEVYAKHPKPLDKAYYRIWFRLEGVNENSSNGYYIGDTMRLEKNGIFEKFNLSETPGDYKLSSVIEIMSLKDSLNKYSSYIIDKNIVVIPKKN